MRGRREADFSHSLTDLMSGLAVMFLLIAAIFMVQSAKATKLAKAAAKNAQRVAEVRKLDADELERLKGKDSQSIATLKGLKQRLEGSAQISDQIQIEYDEARDPFLLTVRFTNEQLRFPSNECQVARVQEEALRVTIRELLPELCGTVPEGDAIVPGGDSTVTISLEGHTDRIWPTGSSCGMIDATGCGKECERRAFDNNVRLSAARAQYVFFQAREVFREDAGIARCIDKNFMVAGRGQVMPLDPKDAAKNRRVEIKVRILAATAQRGPRP